MREKEKEGKKSCSQFPCFALNLIFRQFLLKNDILLFFVKLFDKVCFGRFARADKSHLTANNTIDKRQKLHIIVKVGEQPDYKARPHDRNLPLKP